MTNAPGPAENPLLAKLEELEGLWDAFTQQRAQLDRDIDGAMSGDEAMPLEHERRMLLARMGEVYDAIHETKARLNRLDIENRAIIAERDLLQAKERLSAEYENEAADLRQARERALDEDGVFWFRRFGTTVSIGNAAGLLGVLGAAAQPDARSAIDAAALDVAGWFLGGLGFSALIPVALWLRVVCRKTWPWAELAGLLIGVALAAAGSAAFVWAAMVAIGVLRAS